MLKMINEMMKHNGRAYFNAQELMEKTDLCEKSVSNNLKRLVKIGMIVREDYRLKKGDDCRGRRVRYKIKNDSVIEFIRNNLY